MGPGRALLGWPTFAARPVCAGYASLGLLRRHTASSRQRSPSPLLLWLLGHRASARLAPRRQLQHVGQR
eukprot:12331735-Alexandrium_andersonii.AAC.1